MPSHKQSARTQKRICDAFLDYCITNNEVPTVTQLCALLKIDRGTFYNYYSSILDIADTLIHDLDLKNQPYRQFTGQITLALTEKIMRIGEINPKAMMVLLNPALNLPYRSYIRSTIFDVLSEATHQQSETEETYLVEFVTDGILNTYYRWLKMQDIAFSELTALVYRLVSKII